MFLEPVPLLWQRDWAKNFLRGRIAASDGLIHSSISLEVVSLRATANYCGARRPAVANAMATWSSNMRGPLVAENPSPFRNCDVPWSRKNPPRSATAVYND